MSTAPADEQPIVLHGYYRYTDVFFEWYQAVEDPATLKGLLAHESLVHPDHPLRQPGDKGIVLYNGVLVDGETRLLFSSKQVEYLRYWLHAMQITPKLLPIPHSSYLLSESGLRTVSPVTFTSPFSIKVALKNIEKSNKRLKHAEPILRSRRLYFELVRKFWAERSGTWIAIDFEGWERDHTIITEFGWSLVRWEGDADIRDCGHTIIKEHKQYYNGTYVADARDLYNPEFGQSKLASKATVKQDIADLITEARQRGPVYLVFHDASQDIKYLNSPTIEAPIDGFSREIPENTPTEGIYIVDTADLFLALMGTNERRNLERACRLLGIVPNNVHNAGNDAAYTLQALEEMAGGEPLDIQRERRWPDHTKPAPMPGMSGTNEVTFQPYEEDSDFSDTEGILGGGYDRKTGWLKGYGPETENGEGKGEEAVQENGAGKEGGEE